MRQFSRASADYLQRLSAELAPLSSAAADELLRDFHTELEGLNELESIARIRQLGDPARIRENFAEEDSDSTPTAAPTMFELIALAVYGFAWIPAPLFGWLLGVLLVARSAVGRGFTARAVLLPIALTVGASFLAFVWSYLTSNTLSSPVAWTAIVVGGLAGGLTSSVLAVQRIARVRPHWRAERANRTAN